MSEELVKKVLGNGLSIDEVAERIEFFTKKRQPGNAMIVLLYAETRFPGNPKIIDIRKNYCRDIVHNAIYDGFGKYCKDHIREIALQHIHNQPCA
jgi:hypothetical protein